MQRVRERRENRHMADLGSGRCTQCGTTILWRRTDNGRRIPIDPEPSERGNVILSGPVRAFVLTKLELDQAHRAGAVLFVAHFATCPARKESAMKRKRCAWAAD